MPSKTKATATEKTETKADAKTERPRYLLKPEVVKTFTTLDELDREALRQADEITLARTNKIDVTIRAIKRFTVSKESPFEGGGDLHRDIVIRDVPCADTFLDERVIKGLRSNPLIQTALTFAKPGDGVQLALFEGTITLRVMKGERNIYTYALCKA